MGDINTVHHKPHKMNPTIKTAWSGFKVFAANSNLHGLKYFTENITIIEKLFWAVTFIASIALCSVLINNVLYKWQTSPVIVSFNEEVVPVWKVPFPAITICPQQKMRSSYNFTEMVMKISKHEKVEDRKIKLIDDISAVCYHEFRKIPLGRKDNKDVSSVRNINFVALTVNDIFYHCIWRNDDVNCGDIFKRVLTKDGICFTFNTQREEDMFNMKSIQRQYRYIFTKEETKEWSMDTGYTGNNVKEAYPRIGRQNGAQPDLQIIFKCGNTEETDFMCSTFNNGFKVYMHHPTDMPQASLHYYAVLPKQVTYLATKFNMVSTSHTLKSYSTETRQCYFPSDRQLKYFKTYTQSNCELECVSNYTYKACNCVWFHMPHDNSSQICGNENSVCVVNAKERLSFDEIVIGKAKSEACNCLPACDSVTYDAELHKADFHFTKLLDTMDIIYNRSFIASKNSSRTQYSRLLVYFKESRFLSMRRSELFGTTDFLANCGGLLGLFMGFSFLSIIEIIYFLFIKVLCKKWHKNNKSESVSTNIIEVAFASKTDK